MPVDGRPVGGVGWFDHDRGVQAHLLGEVFADVRVVPVESWIGELDPIGEGLPALYRRLRLYRRPVVAVLQPEAVPVDGCLYVSVVGHPHGYLRALVDVQRRARDRTVVAEHAHLYVTDPLAHRVDAQVEAIAVVKADDARVRRLRESFCFGRERVSMIHTLSFRGLRSVGAHSLLAVPSSPAQPPSDRPVGVPLDVLPV